MEKSVELFANSKSQNALISCISISPTSIFQSLKRFSDFRLSSIEKRATSKLNVPSFAFK